MLTLRVRTLAAGFTTGLASIAIFCACQGTVSGPAGNNPVAVPLVAAPDSSVAVVPSAIVGVATRISVFLRDRLGQEFVSGSESVEIRVLGANGGPDSALVVSYVGEDEYAATQTPMVSGVDSVVVLLNGDTLRGAPYLRSVTVPNVAEPVYDGSNPDHVLHVYEDWSNHLTVSDVGVAKRVDGGPPWVNAGLKKYGSVVDAGDPFGSARYLTTEYVSDPPIPPHGTGPHAAGYHWATAGTFSDFQGDDNAIGGDKNNRSIKLSPTGYLNKPAKSSVVYEWAIRERGTNWFEGKSFDINGGLAVGAARFNYGPFDARLGYSPDCSDELCARYYTDAGRTPLYLGLPPSSNYVAPNINRDSRDVYDSLGVYTIFYKQNVNWGTGPGQFSWGGGGIMIGAFNADLRGAGTPMWEAGWLYTKLRITKQAPGAGYGYGRIEMWIGSTPGALVKVMEYIGDVGGVAEGQVFVDPSGTNDQLAGQINIYELASRRFTGGAIIDIGTIRIWSHSRE